MHQVHLNMQSFIPYMSLYRTLRSYLGVLLIICFPHAVKAESVEATGHAVIMNGDLISAREAAKREALQHAIQQTSILISTNQQVNQGVLEVDNLQTQALGKASHVEIIDERVIGDLMKVRIRAEIITEPPPCENQISNRYLKTVAVTGFPLLYPAQASLGGLNKINQGFPSKLSQVLSSSGNIVSINATHLNLYQRSETAASRQLYDGTLTNSSGNQQQLEVQYLVSGVIRDMSMVEPKDSAGENIFLHYYQKYRGDPTPFLRSFEVDIFLHDAYSGVLLLEQRFNTQGSWKLPAEQRTGFDSAAFLQQEYGQKLQLTLEEISQTLSKKLLCLPYSTVISHTDGPNIWFNAGQTSGIQKGDKLTILRRSTLYTGDLKPFTQLTNTQKTLVVEDVQPLFSRGRLVGESDQYNVLPGDIVTSH